MFSLPPRGGPPDPATYLCLHVIAAEGRDLDQLGNPGVYTGEFLSGVDERDACLIFTLYAAPANVPVVRPLITEFLEKLSRASDWGEHVVMDATHER